MDLNVARAKSKEEHRRMILQWARAKHRTASKILGVPSKLFLHRFQGLNMSRAKKIYFDPMFDGDENIKYRLMHSWPNVEENKFPNPREKDRDNAHKYWKYCYEFDGRELRSVQNTYFTSALDIFEDIEEMINNAIHSSSKDCFETAGHREFKVNEFLAKLHSAKVYPTIHVEKATLSPPGEETKSYQILKEVRLYLKPDVDEYIISPDYPLEDVQGNYIPTEPIYLI